MLKAISVFLFVNFAVLAQTSWIRINQLGYLPNSKKVAVLVSKEILNPKSFTVKNAATNEVVFESAKIESFGKYTAFNSSFRLDFSKVNKKGEYYLIADNIKSPVFKISNDVYDGTADFLLQYMRQQQSGYNPFLKDSCHTHDGFIIYHPKLDSTYIDAKGGLA